MQSGNSYGIKVAWLMGISKTEIGKQTIVGGEDQRRDDEC